MIWGRVDAISVRTAGAVSGASSMVGWPWCVSGESHRGAGEGEQGTPGPSWGARRYTSPAYNIAGG